ncbi:MAG: chorismate synthase [Nitrospirae bacterium GWC2_42_7]|nr:MAG: chorismate synthase [Nitrospirae bacterium GWC2_42_7]
MIRFLTAGESHGKALTGILEGIPSGFSVLSEEIDIELKRRQGGYGRGGRMKIESDHAEILSGIRAGKTTGAPIAIQIKNKDWENWKEIMNTEYRVHSTQLKQITRPRPGHADLAGALKYNHKDMRNILERSSARETAMRVAIGAVAKQFLLAFGIKIGSYVIQIGNVQRTKYRVQTSEKDLLQSFKKAEKSSVRCLDQQSSEKMVRLIDKAIKEGNSLGGIFEVFITGVPVGLGSHIQWDRKLDGRLAQALMSIQAIKGVEIGLGFGMAEKSGSEVMDEIFFDREASGVRREETKRSPCPLLLTTCGFYRKTNNAGGIEGGISNGMPIILRAVMKPIPTLRKPLQSVDIKTKRSSSAAYERSDICAVPAASVVGEAMAAIVIADAFLEKFGGDSRVEIKRNYDSYVSYLGKF